MWLEEAFKQTSYTYCWSSSNGGEENRREEPETISNDSSLALEVVFLVILTYSCWDEHWIEWERITINESRMKNETECEE